MEVAGLAISIASLASLFDTAIDAFRYLQVGKALGVDVQSACLQLDSAQLRLSRWGQAVGVGTATETVVSLQATSFPERDVRLAETLLGHIVNLFHQAEKESMRLRESQSPAGTTDLEANLSPESLALHKRVLDICRRRQHGTSLMNKAKWAIYGREHLLSLVEEVGKSVNNLLELFPAAQQAQRKLCDLEIETIRGLSSWPDFLEIAKTQDKMLADIAASLPGKSVSLSASIIVS